MNIQEKTIKALTATTTKGKSLFLFKNEDLKFDSKYKYYFRELEPDDIYKTLNSLNGFINVEDVGCYWYDDFKKILLESFIPKDTINLFDVVELILTSKENNGVFSYWFYNRGTILTIDYER